MSYIRPIGRGLRPFSDALEQALCSIALRCLNHHWRRAADPGLTEAERRDAEENAAGIIEACRRHGLLNSGGMHA